MTLIYGYHWIFTHVSNFQLVVDPKDILMRTEYNN